MEVNSGRIFIEPTEEQLKRRGMVEIPGGQAEAVINMNRRQRRAWGRYQMRHPGATMEQFRASAAHYLFPDDHAPSQVESAPADTGKGEGDNV